MSKASLKVVAVLVCLCFVLALAPALKSAERGPVRTSPNVLSFLKKPLSLLGSLLGLFPYLPIVDESSSSGYLRVVGSNSGSTSMIKKTTGDDVVVPPPKHD